MNILIIGNGGREHALAWKAAQSERVDHVFIAPGNTGSSLESNCSNVDIAVDDTKSLLTFAQSHHIDLTIVGPEVALAAGVVDVFCEQRLKCFGPKKACAQLESSKAFAKAFMSRHNIPTASYETFTETQKALDYLEAQSYPLVIKADGLAAGKGVVIAEDEKQARDSIINMLEGNQFGDASHRIVIEEFLQGTELSFIVMSDGKNILPLASSKDHKRRDPNDQGPNTGGMGAYSPSPLCDAKLEKCIIESIIQPTLRGMAQDNLPYVGFLYAGLMIDDNGNPKVLEFNCRMGDPETQPIMMRLKSDLVELCLSALNQDLDQTQVSWDERVALNLVLCSAGYPEAYETGFEIEGLDITPSDDVKIFHAGTTIQDANIITNGGRVLGITALGDDLKNASLKAYGLAEKITWSGRFYRKDIA